MAQVYNKRVMRGAIFLLRDAEKKQPLSFDAGMKVLKTAMVTDKGWDQKLLKFGGEIKKKLVEMIEAGHIPATPSLSPATTKLKGNDHYLYDKGALADSFEPTLMKGKTAIRGYAGVALIPNRDQTTHSKTAMVALTNLKLLDVLCQTGIVVYSDEMDPKALRRLMAWRKSHFPERLNRYEGESAGGQLQKVTFAEFRAEMGIADDQVNEDWAQGMISKAKDMGYEIVKKAKEAKTRKRIIFIPPRPLFSNPVRSELNTFIKTRLSEYFKNVERVTMHSLGYEPWNAGNRAKFEANLQGINI